MTGSADVRERSVPRRRIRARPHAGRMPDMDARTARRATVFRLLFRLGLALT